MNVNAVLFKIPKPNCKKYIQFGNDKISLYDAYLCCLPKLNSNLIQIEEDLISVSSKTSNSSSTSSLSESIPEDQDDEFSQMNDKELIVKVKSLIEECHKYNISEYYKLNKIKYRQFNLSSLYSEKNGMSDLQKIKIKDMARKCVDYLKSEHVEKEIEKEHMLEKKEASKEEKRIR
jgi:hypothetical protein